MHLVHLYPNVVCHIMGNAIMVFVPHKGGMAITLPHFALYFHQQRSHCKAFGCIRLSRVVQVPVDSLFLLSRGYLYYLYLEV